jgi:hypothetical protein
LIVRDLTANEELVVEQVAAMVVAGFANGILA